MTRGLTKGIPKGQSAGYGQSPRSASPSKTAEWQRQRQAEVKALCEMMSARLQALSFTRSGQPAEQCFASSLRRREEQLRLRALEQWHHLGGLPARRERHDDGAPQPDAAGRHRPLPAVRRPDRYAIARRHLQRAERVGNPARLGAKLQKAEADLPVRQGFALAVAHRHVFEHLGHIGPGSPRHDGAYPIMVRPPPTEST